MMTLSHDRLIGIAQTHIAVWEERIRMIDEGTLKLFEVRHGTKVDTTAEDRSNLEDLIKYQRAFIATHQSRTTA